MTVSMARVTRRRVLDARLNLVPSELRGAGELRIVDVWRVWRRIAEPAGFNPLDVANVRAVAFRVFDGETDIIALEELPALLDELEGDARRRRPAFVLEELPDGRIAIVADPAGLDDSSLPAALVAFRSEAFRRRAGHLARVRDELRRGPDRPALEAVARRLGISLATAKRLTEGVEMSRNGSREAFG